MQPQIAAFTGYVDLASERLGGKVLLANDEFFAPKENLIQSAPPVFIADRYTDRGKWMDGWETRRRRTPGSDWCILKLGLPGIIRGVDVDTSFFLGNNPSYASLEALNADGNPPADRLLERTWTFVAPKNLLRPGSNNFFPVHSQERWTHIRLHIFPDGGVARLRIYGEVVPDWEELRRQPEVDLAALENGAIAVACSDMFFSPMQNLISPGAPRNMGEGWETRRRRGPGYDWVIVRLAAPGRIRSVVVDTTHFKGNYPDLCSIQAACAIDREVDSLSCHDLDWRELVAQTSLQAHHHHVFDDLSCRDQGFTHVRLNIFPDGGVARLRVFGAFDS